MPEPLWVPPSIALAERLGEALPEPAAKEAEGGSDAPAVLEGLPVAESPGERELRAEADTEADLEALGEALCEAEALGEAVSRPLKEGVAGAVEEAEGVREFEAATSSPTPPPRERPVDTASVTLGLPGEPASKKRVWALELICRVAGQKGPEGWGSTRYSAATLPHPPEPSRSVKERVASPVSMSLPSAAKSGAPMARLSSRVRFLGGTRLTTKGAALPGVYSRRTPPTGKGERAAAGMHCPPKSTPRQAAAEPGRHGFSSRRRARRKKAARILRHVIVRWRH